MSARRQVGGINDGEHGSSSTDPGARSPGSRRAHRDGRGEAVSPALFYRAEAVWPETAEAVTSGRAEDLVPLWSCNTTHAFAGQGRFLLWSAESDEPYEVFGTFAELVQDLLTDLYEDDEDDEERSRIAHLLLPPDEAVGALVPLER